MALIYIDGNDPWLTEYDACEKLYREIMEQLTQRDSESKLSKTFISLSANIRIRLKQYALQIQQLKIKIEDAAKLHTITAEEAERRIRKIEQLQSKEKIIRQICESKTNNLLTSRNQLMGPSTSAIVDIGTTNWGEDSEEDDKPLEVNVSVSDLKTQRQQLMQEQDQGLEELSKVITRQKQMAQTIHNEVDYHNEILYDLIDHNERTSARLIDETKQVQTIEKKGSVCGYWVVIILLFGIIIVISLV